MRKTSILLVIMLIITTILPAGIFADSTGESQDSVKTEENDSADQGLLDQYNEDDESVEKDSTEEDKSDEVDKDLNESTEDPEKKDETPEDPSQSDDTESDSEANNEQQTETPDEEKENNNPDAESEKQEESSETKEENEKNDDQTEQLEEDLDNNEEVRKSEATEENSKHETSLFSVDPDIVKSSTSKLGHLSQGATIYKTLEDDTSAFNSDKYLNAVYYIKKQAVVDKKETFYLISTEPSSKNGVVGWVHEDELTKTSPRKHVGVDKKNKIFLISGYGKATSKAWGGPKDTEIKDLSTLENEVFEVHLTEKIDDTTWYRGKVNGKGAIVWVKESQVKESLDLNPNNASKTSRLGHIREGAKIYGIMGEDATAFSSDDYLNAVYYIKKQATLNNEKYYLISQKPSSTEGVIGWIKASDMSTHSHVGKDKYSKRYYLTGEGKAYTKAWGGSKDLVYNLSDYRNKQFKIHLTEKVGNNIWYRGTLGGKTVWVHSSYVMSNEPEKTSKLGHIRSSNVKIYTVPGNSSKYKVAGDKFINAVYYIKSEITVKNQKYYLISKEPSATKGVVGWVKASDLSTHTHLGKDKKSKTLYFTGKGKAYSKAWGGDKDLDFGDMSKYQSQEFKINLTETVGNNIWYRGIFEGKEIWLHESYVTKKAEQETSKLGHLSKGAKIYGKIGDVSSIVNSSQYLNAVYYIKLQAEAGKQNFYLISKKPRGKDGIVGWVSENDLTKTSPKKHVTVDKKKKAFYLTGKGEPHSKAWGGPKDLVDIDISKYKGDSFNVNLTEKVGGSIWYRGIVNEKTIWLPEAYVTKQKNTYYDLSLEQAIDMQMKVSPQTDEKYAWVSKDYIKNGRVTASTLNVRRGPGTGYGKVGSLSQGSGVKTLGESNGWYAIKFNHNVQWIHAYSEDLRHYLNPKNFIRDEKQKYQFLDLSKNSDASVSVLNKSLNRKGILKGKGQAFIDAGKTYGVNDVYLISHALLETGNGTSILANGVYVDKNGNITRDSKDKIAKTKKTVNKVYNMYGINANDNCSLECGAKKAFNSGWTTPYKAIVGGADFIGEDYVKTGQNTLYKMRWNPEAMQNSKVATHQYATDIGWATKQIDTMYNLYQELDSFKLYLDIPVYK